MSIRLLLSLLLLAPLGARAETSAYAGQQTRDIKALSADEVAGYLAGHGLGLARPAELNGYPGPRHVLDLAGDLKLTPGQTAGLTRVFDAMHTAAVPLGGKLVAEETELDRLFTGRRATDDAVRALTAEIGRLQGELRAVHLQAHLATIKILTPDQVAAYNRLRGYDDPGAPARDHVHHPQGSP
ncbi:MAG TPA: periplasmic heavy metal sensor [Lacunisphaera sp.]|nr:periplasmic heavy metal sensor [Lacunisphaera sp.]